MIASGNYIPSSDWTYGSQVDLAAAECLLKIAFNCECASPANIASIFFRTSPGLDDYNNMDFNYAQDLAKTTRANIEGSINNDENIADDNINQLPDSFYPQDLEGWPEPPELESGDIAPIMESGGVEFIYNNHTDGASSDDDNGDGYIQLLSAPSGRKRKRVYKTLSNQTRFIIERRVAQQADLHAPIDSTELY